MITKRPSINEGSNNGSTNQPHPRKEVREKAASKDANDAPYAKNEGTVEAGSKISISNNSIHLIQEDVDTTNVSPKRVISKKTKTIAEHVGATERPNHTENNNDIHNDAGSTHAHDPRSARTTSPSQLDDPSRSDASQPFVSDAVQTKDTEPRTKAKAKDFVMPKGSSNADPAPFVRHGDANSEMTGRIRHDSSSKVIYMNGERLSRPLSMPSNYKKKSYLLVLLAVLIGVAFLAYYFDTTINAPKREQQAMEQRLEEDIELGLPNMISLLTMDDATILATLQATGDTIFDKSTIMENSTTLELIKLPPDVDVSQAAALYLKGVSKLSGIEAATLLNGSWDLDVDRSKGMNMSIHYADFQSKTVDAAIQNALVVEGLDQTTLLESGEDNSGNTYSTGNVEVAGTTYAWKISALPLKEVYSINGLPQDAVYVGIRFTS